MKILAFLLCLLAGPAFSQTGSVKTPTALNTQVNTLLADNTANQITAFDFRQNLLDVIASYAPLASVSLSGVSGLNNVIQFTIAADTEQCAFCTHVNSTWSYGGATARGTRSNFFGWNIQTAPNSGTGITDGLGGAFIGQSNTGDGGTGLTNALVRGAFLGANLIGRNNGTNVQEVAGLEADSMTTSTSSQRYAFGVTATNYEAVQGSTLDSAFVVYSGGSVPAAGGSGPWGPGVGFHCGLCFAELSANGLVPLDSGATVLGTSLDSLSTFPVANGVDLRGFTVSGLAFATTGFKIDGTGFADIDKNATPASVPVAATNSLLRLAGADSTSPIFDVDSFSGASTILGRRTGGTAASKAGVGNGDALLLLIGQGWNSSAAYSGNSTQIQFVAAETFTNTAMGSKINFLTTPNTTVAPATAVTIQNSGGMSIGGAADPGIGSIAASKFLQSGVTVVGSLPACNSGTQGARYFVTDQATAVAYHGAVTGSGASKQGVTCDGSAWYQN